MELVGQLPVWISALATVALAIFASRASNTLESERKGRKIIFSEELATLVRRIALVLSHVRDPEITHREREVAHENLRAHFSGRGESDSWIDAHIGVDAGYDDPDSELRSRSQVVLDRLETKLDIVTEVHSKLLQTEVLLGPQIAADVRRLIDHIIEVRRCAIQHVEQLSSDDHDEALDKLVRQSDRSGGEFQRQVDATLSRVRAGLQRVGGEGAYPW